MKIAAIKVRCVELPIREPMVTSNIRIESVCFLVVEVSASNGATGSSYIWAFNQAGARTLANVIDHLSSVVLGGIVFYTAKLWQDMWRATIQWGHSGMSLMAMGALDAAIWDLIGRVTEQPLANLLGRSREKVPVYASGLWITDDLARLQQEAEAHLAKGYRAMKMRVGRGDVDRDVAAVAAVREVIGAATDLMVDFSSALRRPYATKLAHALEPFGLYWIEDPIADEDVLDHAELADKLRTPICFGEKVYGSNGLQKIIDARAADVLMADMQRVGGVTGWARCAAMADTARLPLTSHLLPELNVHLVSSAPTGGYLEMVDWAEELFLDRLVVVDGFVSVPERPGFGLEWDRKALERRTVAYHEFTAGKVGSSTSRVAGKAGALPSIQ